MQWHKKSLPILKEQFAYLGVEDNNNTLFEQTSYSEFTYYASGRQNCFYSLFKMEMMRRHCAISTLLTERFQPADDVLTVDIPIRFPNADPGMPSAIPIEFFLTKASKKKQAMTQFEHFTQFVSQVKLENLPNNPKIKNGLVALAECDEVGNQLIDKNVAEVL